MSLKLPKELTKYLENAKDETIKLIEELCSIPAPTGHEEKRAEFCKAWLEKWGAEGVYIDSALNVLYPVGCEGKDDIVLFMAHTDTVFPDTEPMPFYSDGEYLYSPGVGDDTTCLAVLLMIAKYVAKNKMKAPCGVLFAANSCEEGLGNLKGIRQIMEDYSGRISAVYSFDGQYDTVVNRCVGSHRYEVTFKTRGGHSFRDFGKRNAILSMSKFVCSLYECRVPEKVRTKTTYNVGVVEGGTSVNTIAEEVKLLVEYRSDDEECLEEMKRIFEEEIDIANSDYYTTVTAKLIGERPCAGDVDKKKFALVSNRGMLATGKYSKTFCKVTSGSTDCNIPMSMGIPAIAVGSYRGSGEHTREEKVLIESIPVGLKIAAEIIFGYFYDDLEIEVIYIPKKRKKGFFRRLFGI